MSLENSYTAASREPTLDVPPGIPPLHRSTAPEVVPPVAEGIFTLPPYDESGPHLLGGRCGRCGRVFFPKPLYCCECLEVVETADLGSWGAIYSYTVVRARVPLDLPQPYGVGQVDLDGSGLRVFSLLDPDALDQLKIGLRVRLAVRSLGVADDGLPRLRPYFTPRPSDQEARA